MSAAATTAAQRFPVGSDVLRAVGCGMADRHLEQADRALVIPNIVTALEHLRVACRWLISAAKA